MFPNRAHRSIKVHRPVQVVGERHGQHAPGGNVLRAAEIEARLDSPGPSTASLGWDVDLVRGEHELRLGGQRVGNEVTSVPPAARSTESCQQARVDPAG